MNPNLLNYNYRPLNSSTIPILASSNSPTSSVNRLNQVNCLSSSDGSINSGMINEMQSSSYLPFDDQTSFLNLFINESDNCSTMAPKQMTSNDLISDQSHQQLAGTTNDHPYSRVERDSRTDHQLTPISNSYVSNSSNLLAARINSNSIGGNSQHHHPPLHSHSTHHHHHHSPQPQHPHQQHQQPLHPSHQRQQQQQQQHSMSHHLLAPHSQPSHSLQLPHQPIHNYVQQPNSNHTLYSPNYLTRSPNMVNHGSPEQCRGLNSPNPSPGGGIRDLHVVFNDNSPPTRSPASGSSSSLVAATNSNTNSYQTSSQSTNSSQATNSSQSTISSQKSDDLSQKASQTYNCDSERKKLTNTLPITLGIPCRLVEPAPPSPPTLQPPKPEVIDISPNRPREEQKDEKVRINTTAPLPLPSSPPNGTVDVQVESVTIFRVVHRLRYEGRVVAETVVNEHESVVPLGNVKLTESELEQKTPFTISTFGQLRCSFPYSNDSDADGISGSSISQPRDSSRMMESKFSVRSSSSSANSSSNAESTTNKSGSNMSRKFVKPSLFKEIGSSIVRDSRSSTESSTNTSTAIKKSSTTIATTPTSTKSCSNKRKASSLSSSNTSNKKMKRTGKRINEETSSTKKESTGGDNVDDLKMKDKVKESKEGVNLKEELIDNEETRRATATVLLSLHGDSSLVRMKEKVSTPEIVIDKIREPEFRPIERDNQVFAKWARDKNFYPGKATSPQMDSKWLITFDDGEQRSVHESEIISVPYLVPGQQVMLTYSNDSCAQRIIKKCFVREGVDVEYQVENDDTRYPTRKIFLTSEMAAILLGKQSKLPSNASKFADVDLNNIIPKRSRVTKPTTPLSSSAPLSTSSSNNNSNNTSISLPVSHTVSSDDPSSYADSDTGSVNSYKSTKSRSTSFSKQFLPALSPSSNRSNEILSHKTKKTSGKSHPSLPYPFKKINDSSSSSSSMKNERPSSDKATSSSIGTTSASKTSNLVHQGEKEKLLGPIPSEGSNLFAKIGFLLTTTDGTNKSNGAMPSSEAGSSIPFDADYLITQIKMGSGKIFDSVDSARSCTEINETVLIAYTYLKTSLYMQCLHGGIPCVMHTWVIECCRDGQLLHKSKYLLPSGYSIIKSNLSSDKNVYKKSAYLFKGSKIMIADSKLIDKWKPVLITGLAEIVSSLPASTGSSTRKATNSVDFIVAENNCPPAIIKKAQQMNIPIVTSEYLAQCLINGRKLSHDSHNEFKYK